jgi:hypothetical protein
VDAHFSGAKVDLHSCAEWLRRAAGVLSVDLDTAAFDDCFGYCETADDYFDRKSAIGSVAATALTVFLFTWGGFEALATTLFSRRHIKRAGGKVKTACNALNGSNGGAPQLSGYRETLSELYEVLTIRGAHSPGLRRLKETPGNQLAGAALSAVYELRNDFAHGDFRFPAPPDEMDRNDPDNLPSIRTINLSSRLVLLTMQMLIISILPGAVVDVPREMRRFEDEDEEEYLAVLMKVVHLQGQIGDEDEDQLNLFEPERLMSDSGGEDVGSAARSSGPPAPSNSGT